MSLHLLAALALTSLVACSDKSDDDTAADDTPVDTDGDGLTDDEEASLGTDPTLADTDDDGLSDSEEVELGTDPTVADTDGDTYLDFDEITEGTDPNDPDNRIYIGYWPYNRDKDSIVGTDLSDTVGEGDVFGHLVGPDQYGDELDLYDFAGQGKYTVIDLSGMWCSYCQEMAKYLAGQSSFFDDYEGYYPLDEMRTLVDDGTLQWVTILDANAMGNSITQSGLETWDGKYPNSNVAIMGDLESVIAGHINVYGYPSLLLLDDQMNVVTYDREDYMQVVIDAAALGDE